ncbi:uncharacterized protein [Blastocystis hominis]|uniref:RRM domain-containing protein n=1 Tax=Blastocystis hominis TaxID=12968 RepID=D8LXC1_BLAHO|nr:uncharacterized protein [Blastocystis hominis]CBK20916.2 unnamed protein product [Blastocystis hominis]|eukprot:XP_012894964.1 uncharacterized protein [Blastocystis hominis]
MNSGYNSFGGNRSASSKSTPTFHGQWKKLFIGQIPKSFTEQDVIHIFEDTCPVFQAHIIRDKQTNEHKGCAFIYVEPKSANLIKEKYHNKYICPNMMNNLQVKDAINSNRNSSNHDDKPHSTFAPHKDRPSSDSPHPYHPSEPIPSESADQTSLPDGASTQPAPAQPSPSAPQPSLPAMYPIQYYPIYPSNFLFPSNFQPAMTSVSPRTARILALTPPPLRRSPSRTWFFPFPRRSPCFTRNSPDLT